ncbi:MAG: T9SS type A sorting domain-containing protein [Bacteroidota bacterium]
MNTPHRHIAWRVLLLLGLLLPAGRSVAQVDLYIRGEVMLSGIQDTLYVNGDVIYDGFGNGKICMVALSHFYFTGDFINRNPSDLPFYVDANPLLRSRGTVVADQGFPQEIGGIGRINFHTFRVQKVLEMQSVRLSRDISLTDKLEMIIGDLNVDSSVVYFSNKDTASYILGETSDNRIYGSIGHLETKRFASLSLIDPANLGMAFSGLQDSVLVRRYFSRFTNVASGSIARHFQVKSGNLSIQSAAGSARYLAPAETAGFGDEEDFRLYRSNDDSLTWAQVPSTVDTAANVVSSTNLAGSPADTLLFTIADSDCPNPPVVTLGADTAFCDGDTVQLDAGTGTNWSYLWSNGDTTQTTTVRGQTDTLSVIVSDGNGCAGEDTIVVTRNPLPFVSLSDTVAACAGLSATLDALNPSASYLWSTTDTTQMINLSHLDTIPGMDTVWVVVTDSNGCMASDSNIFQKSPAPIVELGGAQYLCGGANTLLEAANPGPAGNVGATYAWSTGATVSGITVGMTGQYSVTVTNAYTCESADTVQVDVAPALSATATGTDISCNGAADGQVNLNLNGGIAPFSYTWNNSAITQNLSNLVPGTYNVTVSDSLGCTATASATISQPVALTLSLSATDVSCFAAGDGTVSTTVSGGIGPYNYLWNNAATSTSLSAVGPATYAVTVTDANGCTISDSAVINEPAVLAILLNSTQDPACFGDATGTIDIAVTGGNGGYAYSWSNNAVTQDLSGLTAGSYAVTVTDLNNCSAADTFALGQPSVILLSETHLNVPCFGDSTGAIDLTVSGGTPGYTYQWSNAATSQDLNAVAANTYSVTVTDANNCTDTLSATLTQPNGLIVSATGYDATCGANDGQASAQVSGGEMPYNYFWPTNGSILDSISNLSAGIYTVVVTDDNGCVDSANTMVNNAGAPTVTVDSVRNIDCFGNANGYIATSSTGGVTPYTYLWSNGATTDIISGLAPGTYDLTVTANDGCQAFASQLITEPPLLTGTGIVTDLSCFGDQSGAIDFIPGGGTLPYSYLWSNAATSEDVNSLAAGSYTVTVTDSLGCTDTTGFVLSEPPQLLSTTTATDVNCAGGADGAIDLEPAGGTPGYSYNWSNGQNSQDINGLVAGTYFVTITDQNQCTQLDTAVVAEPPALVLALDSTDILCNGQSDGAIDLTVNGGIGPYGYAWSNGATSEDLVNLAPGSYTVTVTDANGCAGNASTFISEPTLLQLNLSSTDVHCGGNATGSATASVVGGTPAYSYTWNTTATDSSLTDLTAGNYQVTVTDANGCTVSGQVEVIEPPTLSLSGTVTDVSCEGQADGFVLTSPFGGSAPYSYAWSNGDTTPDLIGVVSGSYTVTITDQPGCTFEATFDVEEGDSALDARFLAATVVNSLDTVYFLEFSIPEPTTTTWDFGDGSTSNERYPAHAYADDPNVDTSYYEVKFIAANAWCTDSVLKTITVVNSSGKQGAGPGGASGSDILGVRVYPNPNQGQFDVRINLSRDMGTRVTIYDLQGRLIDKRLLSGARIHNLAYSMDNLVQGIYLLKVSTATSSQVVRVVIL